MAEPDDMVLPILKNIQDRLATMDARLVDVQNRSLEHDERFDRIESLMTFHPGLTTEHTHRIEELGKDLKSLKGRVAALES